MPRRCLRDRLRCEPEGLPGRLRRPRGRHSELRSLRRALRGGRGLRRRTLRSGMLGRDGKLFWSLHRPRQQPGTLRSLQPRVQRAAECPSNLRGRSLRLQLPGRLRGMLPGSCVDTRTDVEHCGACGLRCDASGRTPACSAGKCMVRCDSGLSACGTRCVNLLTDPEHCGTCDNVCLLNLVCVGGSCVVDL